MSERTSSHAGVEHRASERRGWVAALATLTGLGMSPLLGCGGLASDGHHPADDGETRIEALPQRFTDCNALRAYASTQARDLLSLAPTGNPLEPLFAPTGAAGFELPAYAEWPETTRQPGAGRSAHGRRAGADDYYLVADDVLNAISVRPSQLGGGSYPMPPALVAARAGGAPAWVFVTDERVLVVGAMNGAGLSGAPEGTFFWQLDLKAAALLRHQELRYVDARLVGARRIGDSVQVVLLAAGSRLGLEPLPAEQRTDALRLADVRARNGAAIDSAAAGDWLPLSVSADAETGLPVGQGAAAIECNDIYAPATPSGLQLLTLVDLDFEQGLDSWSASGLYTGNVQVFADRQRWALVTEPWWSVSEEASQRAAQGEPETILHTFDTGARQLEPRGSIALHAAPQHDPVAAADGERWFLATHAAYGPALSGDDLGRIWSFQTRQDALGLLGKSPVFALSPETQTEFAPGVAYVHAQGGSNAAAGSVVIDLADPGTLEPEDGPSGDFRVLPWSDGQHLRVDLSQIHLLSGLSVLEQYPQGPEPNFVAYALPEQGWLLDVQGPSYRQTLRFRRLAQPNALQTMGSILIRRGALLPPLIEDDVILNGSYQPRGISGSSPFSLEAIDANTFGTIGGVSGG